MTDFILVIIIMLVTSLFFFMVGAEKGQYNLQIQAIEKGYAQYCATTGKWAWKNDCK